MSKFAALPQCTNNEDIYLSMSAVDKDVNTWVSSAYINDGLICGCE